MPSNFKISVFTEKLIIRLRNTFVERLQDVAAEFSARVTILGGDVHLAALGRFYSNPKLKIGGALFLNPRTLHVMQVLEGPSAAVRMLYDKIAEDKRHNSCVVMSEEIVSARTFEQWGMLQGDAKEADWAAVAAGGWVKGHAASRRARRNGRETDGDEPAAEIIAANTATPTQAQMME